MADPKSAASASTPRTKEQTAELRKRVVALVLAAIVIVFALVNRHEVRVNWIVASGSTPLIVVIVVSLAVGVGADRLVIARGKRRRGRVEP